MEEEILFDGDITGVEKSEDVGHDMDPDAVVQRARQNKHAIKEAILSLTPTSPAKLLPEGSQQMEQLRVGFPNGSEFPLLEVQYVVMNASQKFASRLEKLCSKGVSLDWLEGSSRDDVADDYEEKSRQREKQYESLLQEAKAFLEEMKENPRLDPGGEWRRLRKTEELQRDIIRIRGSCAQFFRRTKGEEEELDIEIYFAKDGKLEGACAPCQDVRGQLELHAFTERDDDAFTHAVIQNILKHMHDGTVDAIPGFTLEPYRKVKSSLIDSLHLRLR